MDYGIPALAASIAVPLKLLLFYGLIGISANFILVWLITCILTYILFASFKNKWIPAVIYLLLSVLMFCDVTYSSFFNRYLSVNMLAAAGVLDDITESIKQVLKPWFFLTLADAALAVAALAAGRRRRPKGAGPAEETGDASAAAAEEAGAETSAPMLAAGPQEEAGGAKTDASAAEPVTGPQEASGAETGDALPETAAGGSAGEPAAAGARTAMKYLLTGKTAALAWVSGHKKQVAALLILCVLVFNSSASYLITSLSNQEIYSYHIKDVLNKLTGNSMLDKNPEFRYAVTDSYETEKDSPLFGVAKGRNLIVIQVESLQNLVVNRTYNGQEITPNLNGLIKGDTVYFDRYYQQIGSGNTSDAEFATNNSIYGTLASYTYKLFPDNYYRGLPVLLGEQGYETAVLHAYEDRDFWNREEMYKSLGFDTFYGGIGGMDKGQFNMTEWMGWGLTDSEFFKQAITYLKEMAQPFYSFIITLSNHHPFEMLDKYKFIDLLPEDEGTIFGNYLNSAAYTDYSIGLLMQELKDAGLYENSIIAIYGDHLGLPKSDAGIYESVSRFLGKDYDFDTMMNIPLIISVPGADQNIRRTVSTVGGQLDFLPTVACLMGFDSLDTVYLGHNLLTVGSGFVAEQTYMTKGSFFSDDIAYEMSRDGVFENGRAWNPKTGEAAPVEDCYDGYMKSMGLINASEYILKNDVLRGIYEDEKNAASVFSNSPAAGLNYPDKIAEAGAPGTELLGTNSREALDASYDAGYRDISVDICWTEDKEAVLLSSWKDLGKYFDTTLDSAVSLEKFQSLKMKNGLTPMDCLDLISWTRKHPDVTVYAQAERSEDWFMKTVESYAADNMHQFVAMVPGMVEYSGLYPSVLNTGVGGNTADQLLEFIRVNHVAAVSLSREASKGEYKKVLKADCVVYIKDDQTGIFKRKN
jgi:phosphoglycerol transferase MdoB-like AlkP superfamily enzyme